MALESNCFDQTGELIPLFPHLNLGAKYYKTHSFFSFFLAYKMLENTFSVYLPLDLNPSGLFPHSPPASLIVSVSFLLGKPLKIIISRSSFKSLPHMLSDSISTPPPPIPIYVKDHLGNQIQCILCVPHITVRIHQQVGWVHIWFHAIMGLLFSYASLLSQKAAFFCNLKRQRRLRACISI